MAFAFVRGKRFWIEYRDRHNRRPRIPTKAKTKTEARRMAEGLEQREERIRLGLEKELRPDVTIAAAWKEHLAALPSDYRSLASLKSRGKRITAGLGSRLCRELGVADAKLFINGQKDIGPQSKEHLRVALQGLFTFLEADARVESNPAKLMGKVRVPRREPLFWEPDDIPAIFNQLSLEWRDVFAFSLATGLRKNEALDVLKANVKLGPGYVLVPDSKTGDSRRVYFPDWLRVLLVRRLRTRPDSEFLFPNPEGKRWSRSVRLHERIKDAIRRAGLAEKYPKTRWKELRSTYATHAWALTDNGEFVSRQLGHKDPRTTRRYAAGQEEHLRRLASKASEKPVIQLSVNRTTPMHGKRGENEDE